MLAFARKQWFLIALSVVVPLGIWLGYGPLTDQVATLDRVIDSQWLTFAVLLLMAFTLDSRQLKHSFSHPGPVLWASVINFGLLPLIAWPISRLQGLPDYQVGILLAAAAPCTLASASVWTRRANGNDAVSLLVTLVTNLFCFVLTPFWLFVTLGETVELDPIFLMKRLLFTVVLPMTLGQLLRLSPQAARFATERKPLLGNIAQSLLLLIVFTSSLKGGTKFLTDANTPALWETIWMAVCCLTVHVTAMAAGIYGAKLLGMTTEDCIAVAFASSQKTLPIAVLLAELMPSAVVFAVFPTLIYHILQLFFDTLIADRYAARTTGTSP